MILLGSIERTQLQALLSNQLGRPRRLEYLRQRSQNEKKHCDAHISEENVHKNNQEVRFQVSAGVSDSLPNVCVELCTQNSIFTITQFFKADNKSQSHESYILNILLEMYF